MVTSGIFIIGQVLWREQSPGAYVKTKQLWDFEFTADVALKSLATVSVSQRSDRRAGFAISLDCCFHSGQSWSITGNGMQCQWDTSRRAGCGTFAAP